MGSTCTLTPYLTSVHWCTETTSPSRTRRLRRTTLLRRTRDSSVPSSASTMHTVSLRFLPGVGVGVGWARCVRAALSSCLPFLPPSSPVVPLRRTVSPRKSCRASMVLGERATTLRGRGGAVGLSLSLARGAPSRRPPPAPLSAGRARWRHPPPAGRRARIAEAPTAPRRARAPQPPSSLHLLSSLVASSTIRRWGDFLRSRMAVEKSFLTSALELGRRGGKGGRGGWARGALLDCGRPPGTVVALPRAKWGGGGRRARGGRARRARRGRCARGRPRAGPPPPRARPAAAEAPFVPRAGAGGRAPRARRPGHPGADRGGAPWRAPRRSRARAPRDRRADLR